ncbi:hypothetical protein E2C01_089918 [Portunus trituberculatus]|uniref:Uncharacterized protein n=1 Tax=Portunus trituberculatus TaxID=210409 RepID=A0A5B7JJJ3_PORTR|nr:hypothetical protein [Portunus trituberculatus]
MRSRIKCERHLSCLLPSPPPAAQPPATRRAVPCPLTLHNHAIFDFPIPRSLPRRSLQVFRVWCLRCAAE